jgi:transposase
VVTDPTGRCELLVGLPEVTVLGLDDEVGAPLSIHVETRTRRPGCSECGVLARVKDRPVVTLVDLAAFGRPTRLVWHKFRWHGAEPTCPGGSWTDDEPRIATKRLMLSDRAGRVGHRTGRPSRQDRERDRCRARL